MNIPPPAYKVNDDSQAQDNTQTPMPVASNVKADDKRINDLGTPPPQVLPSFPVKRKLIS